MAKIGRLKIVYALALADLSVLAVWGFLYDAPGLVGIGGLGEPTLSLLMLVTRIFMLGGFIVAAAPIVFLIVRPMGWGKLLLPFAGLSWIGHAGIIWLMSKEVMHSTGGLHIPGLWVPLVCGIGMFALAIAHQIIDPRFFSNGRALGALPPTK